MSFVFYDTETTGSNTFYDQILQFAAIRTDDALKEIDRFEIRCRIQPHVLPAPGALLVTGVTLCQLSDPGLPSHFEMAAAIHAKLTEWSPAVFAGYNSLEFDEGLLRQAFYQSLLPVYLTNTGGSSRLDILQLALATNEFAPGLLKIPERDDGVPTFRLDRLAPANGFLHPNAHDAMADVEATVFLAKTVKEGAPWIWDHLLRMGQKAEALREAKASSVRLYTEFRFNKPNHWLVSAIDADPSNKGNVIAFNLAHDPAELLSVGDDSLRKWVLSKPKPLRTIKANSSPILLNIDMAQGRADIMKIGEGEIMRRAKALQESYELRHRLLKAYVETREVYEDSPHIEEQIYGGFPGSGDTALMREFHRSSWPARIEIASRFEDDRLRRIARRIVFNHRPDLFSEDMRQAFSKAIAQRWLAKEKVKWLTIEGALGEIEERREGCSYEQALSLEAMEAYFVDKRAWAEGQLAG
ncbi:exodeoxyribonuclease I [Aestuariivirga litoralis]|uniref:Exodeoxyribonuclease I n=1 Tax=Aestuariivirga litoralis TaxID=2650924 RepID=A0A2W2B6C3_9HYPH|nr:exonuclease domain-containing protein [Aestuariivirga litoralis]PZF75864.1 exodeoxyribonuclease I [Aestuariivirga litoralis]